MWKLLLDLWREPRPAQPTHSSLWGRAITIVFAAVMLLEALLRQDLHLRGLQIVFGFIIAVCLWFRRSHTLQATIVSFGVAIVFTTLSNMLGVHQETLNSSVCVLLISYSLFRWGSGREVGIGLVAICGAYLSATLNQEMRSATDAIGAAVVMLFPCVLGASVRFRASAHQREIEHIRLQERELLARELHDTVAHHVTAIAIQAQAGRVVLKTKPDATLNALASIEKEASRALAELRSIVSTLRDQHKTDLAPVGMVADIKNLAQTTREGVLVTVDLLGDLDELRPSLQTALYRIAQESVTNALRHAHSAKNIHVQIKAEDSIVRLTVNDDGEPTKSVNTSGFGLIGMAERATLLGGTLTAAPGKDRGWKVEAMLPYKNNST